MVETQARGRTYRIRRTEQIEALASPVRQEIVDALQVSGACPIAEVAAQLGRAPDSLYYHVRHLERVGLVVRRGVRRNGQRDEALFGVPGARSIQNVECSPFDKGAGEHRNLFHERRGAARTRAKPCRADQISPT